MEATLRRTMNSVTDTLFPVPKSLKDPQKHQIIKAGNNENCKKYPYLAFQRNINDLNVNACFYMKYFLKIKLKPRKVVLFYENVTGKLLQISPGELIL